MKKKIIKLLITATVVTTMITPIMANASTIKSTNKSNLVKAELSINQLPIKVDISNLTYDNLTNNLNHICNSEYGEVYAGKSLNEQNNYTYFFTLHNVNGVQKASIVGFSHQDANYTNNLTLNIPDEIQGYPVDDIKSGNLIQDKNLEPDYWKKVTTVTLSDNVQIIDDSAFLNFSNLTTVSGKDLRNFNFRNPIKIGDSAFAYTAINDITTDGNSISSIGAYAFAGTKITNLSLTNIYDVKTGAFATCQNLNSVKWSINNEQYDILNNHNPNLSETSTTDLKSSDRNGIFQYCSKLTSANIDVIYGSSEFEGDYNLKDVTVNKVVTEIPAYTFDTRDGQNISKDLYVDFLNNDTITNIEDYAIVTTNVHSKIIDSLSNNIYGIKYTDNSIISNNINLSSKTSTTTPSTVTGDYPNPPEQTDIPDMPNIPTDTTIVPDISKLQTSGSFGYIEKQDNTLDFVKFTDNDLSLYVPSEINGKKVTSISNTNITKTSYGYITVPTDVVTSIASAPNVPLISVIIPDTVTSIEFGAFANSPALEYVQIPYSVTEIKDYAFTNCPNLKEIVLPNRNIRIGKNAFDSSVKISYATDPKPVTNKTININIGTNTPTISITANTADNNKLGLLLSMIGLAGIGTFITTKKKQNAN